MNPNELMEAKKRVRISRSGKTQSYALFGKRFLQSKSDTEMHPNFQRQLYLVARWSFIACFQIIVKRAYKFSEELSCFQIQTIFLFKNGMLGMI